jgi:UDP-3-O-[3-hydroxymyristoyl] glucosamine N-acyltransferase
MPAPSFFTPNAPVTLGAIAALVGGAFQGDVDPETRIANIAPLEDAGPGDIAYLENPAYLEWGRRTAAAACITSARFAAKLGDGPRLLVVRHPQRAFAQVAAALFPAALRPQSLFGASGVSPGAIVHPSARLEPGVTVDPGVVIGPGVEIGSGTIVCAQAAVGPGVRIGRDCAIGPGVTLTHALVGNRVILHAGCRIGQDGFGFAMGPQGHLKAPQIGRVVIQDDVEIGANTTIDRGATRDTVIGEGSKIDNLVQIAHNVVVGRHCVIVAQAGISGSTTLEDFVVVAGKAGTVGHVRIGRGAQLGAGAGLTQDIPPGERWGGYPARPLRQWAREVATLKRLAKRGASGETEDGGDLRRADEA